ncbi:rod shape-determining protein [Candidatus Curtissbacteria bacterium RIFCSPHIGHO2_12_FULL_38_9b]|uniref:Cell shape-determining protein MreB n=1 Tax=Candidatus Curtissbacteria bacterium RIFCSPHIGHO2_12_FULL_38_9b TaxID=1797720 RepID=A0A1F5H0I4_9BACT|nr:MAG: rod shape-determining protein [Candidatus Curtissbacteria bacterium RIFCSPHIGHO2_12_FULL_38_9b]
MKIPFLTSKRLAIDLGTANSLVWSSGEGVVLSEPSVVAVDSESGKVMAVGSGAYEMLGRTGAGTNLLAQKPLQDGVVADYLVCQAMIKYFLDRVLGTSRFVRPDVMVCVPSGVTQVERRAVLEATLSAGAKTAYLIEHTLAAAIGAKLPIDLAVGSMIVDIGAGQTGAAVVSLGGVVVSQTAKVGGVKLDEAIINHMRHRHNLIIGERMAEEIKLKIGNTVGTSSRKVLDAKGRDAILGMPKTITVDSGEISDAMSPVLSAIIACVKSVLEQTPPELASDIIDRGIVLSGGSSQLVNIDRLISTHTGVSAHVAEDPQRCVVYGTGVALENIDKWKRLLHSR